MKRTIYNARTLNAMHQMIGADDYFQQVRSLQVVADGKEDGAYYTALGDVLAACSNLEHLELKNFFFARHFLTEILRGLNETSMSSLSFDNCLFEQFSALVFTYFYMQCQEGKNHFGDGPIKSTLRKLQFKGGSVAHFFQVDFGHAIECMLVLPDPSRTLDGISPTSTIGLQLTSLSVDDVSSRDFRSLCNTLANVADDLHLETLRLMNVRPAAFDSLVRLATKFASHGKTLIVGTLRPQDLIYTLLCYLRDAGDHYHPVSLLHDDQEGSSILDEGQVAHAQAFTTRNVFFRLEDEDDDRRLSEAYIFPMILEVAKTIPALQSTRMFQALLTLPDADRFI
jgi:hypothetical protein